LTPEFSDELAEKFAGFIPESLDEDDEDDPGAISFRLSINCIYPGKLADLDVDALRETVPSAVTGLGVAVALNSFLPCSFCGCCRLWRWLLAMIARLKGFGQGNCGLLFSVLVGGGGQRKTMSDGPLFLLVLLL